MYVQSEKIGWYTMSSISDFTTMIDYGTVNVMPTASS